jgi:hypothetical protein
MEKSHTATVIKPQQDGTCPICWIDEQAQRIYRSNCMKVLHAGIDVVFSKIKQVRKTPQSPLKLHQMPQDRFAVGIDQLPTEVEMIDPGANQSLISLFCQLA